MSEALIAAPKALHPDVAKRGISEAQWNTLCRSLFPGANPTSVLMVVDYCAARKLDPLKKPCHIVPMQVRDAKTGAYDWRDVVMPGIYEYRTTAQRTGDYLGHAKPEYGPDSDHMGVTAPEWCDFTAYRWNGKAAMRSEFPVRVKFREVVALTRDKKSGDMKVNDRWSKAPFQMLTKCAEAAALREAFPDELGGEQTADEMEGQRAHELVVDVQKPAMVKPDGYDEWLESLVTAADKGADTLAAAWQVSPQDKRIYFTAIAPDAWEALRDRAMQVEPEAGK